MDFVTGMVSGVDEYNAVRKGHWKEFAVAATMDIGSIAIGAVTGGTGYVAVKAGTTGAKVVTKEVAKESVKKLAKEGLETEVKKSSNRINKRRV
ncbi:hypothetical protein MXZ23_09500 [Streptococcus uberis]|uniref:hypothetical protein n=1 Tax=Streptococcus uberis TaxID=1349 RepID=UPI0027DE7EAA|nr:hypothetical protein [Streptococcus uberis]MCK1193758.1 hypothetical protein [Streptococcus uberis]